MIKIESTNVNTLEHIRQGLKCDIAKNKKEFLTLPQDTPTYIKTTYKDYIKYLEDKLESILTQLAIVKNSSKKELTKLNEVV